MVKKRKGDFYLFGVIKLERTYLKKIKFTEVISN
tara:strand:+ start:427 stop:528 length:102 start_codon:yes stop_codon:yes gene_type:complete